jgi:hypothetical protein
MVSLKINGITVHKTGILTFTPELRALVLNVTYIFRILGTIPLSFIHPKRP